MPSAAALASEGSEHTAPGSGGVTLLLTFPGRRYQATPWGHHVNEGLVEWPPSPWRLLRSFLATGYAKLRWPKDGPPAAARRVIEKLASVLPSYHLPNAVGAHSRHYMPLARFNKGREETTLVLDTWAQIDGGEIGVHWNVALTPLEEQLLAEIVRELGYLGRSESWVEAELTGDVDLSTFDVRPGEAADCPGPGWEQVSLVTPVPAPDYAVWRERAVRSALDGLPQVNARGKPLTKAQKSKQIEETHASYPVDLIACLQVDTAWLQDLGWNQPPGSHKVLYWRRAASLEAAGPQGRSRPKRPPAVEVMLLSMATASGNLHALPPITRVLPQGELLHRALLSHCSGAPPLVLSGRDIDGTPLRGELGHRHAHLIHLDLDADGHLDHALVWAPMGLDTNAQNIVRAVRKTYTKGGAEPLRLAVAASGSLSELRAFPTPWGHRLRELLGERGGSMSWRSETPFVPPRFLKARGSNSLEGQISAELRSRGLPEPIAIRRIDPHDDDLARKSRHFVRRRGLSRSTSRPHLPPPIDCGFILELTFASAVCGPLALGYGCHYGLGLFAATTDS